MVALLLLFLTLPVAVFTKDPKCPDGFLHFKRTPTAKNNHTKDWCVKVFSYSNTGNRDYARSVCIANHAMLTIPENRAEYEAIGEFVRKNNYSAPHAIDGELSSRCKARYLHKWFDTNTVEGECNIKKNLFMFDDINTDPSYILTKFGNRVPSGGGEMSVAESSPKLIFLYGCMVLTQTHLHGNEKALSFANLEWCGGKAHSKNSVGPESLVDSVVCGRHPE
ncbi:hypothetical protein GCK72_004469 [Caenorhabditis remanei]|uniref:C-type lectin domain-containing protein n=1 Tax=Caenorhabditis remanei TaxID=31234 RepID=A0A6A5HC80_CAERE|nr:hypothetical protein GCK72_004469 [Caenorhabditis remanei]KAF1764521.1 hypothetical protein GCK72_004469 [Caenorhabditis remanei]